MTRLTAFAIGIVLAAGLALATPADRATDLVDRYHAATTEAGLAASWRDWHPDAVHDITVKVGMGQKDWRFSYAMSDWDTLPGWMDDPEVREAMKGYRETGRSTPAMSVISEGKTIVISTETRVDYVWDSYTGSMTQTDRFEIVSLAGRQLIRKLSTTYDYR